VPKGPQTLSSKVFGPVGILTAKYWPGVPVVAATSAGATDGAFLTPAGIPTYGVSGIFRDEIRHKRTFRRSSERNVCGVLTSRSPVLVND